MTPRARVPGGTRVERGIPAANAVPSARPPRVRVLVLLGGAVACAAGASRTAHPTLERSRGARIVIPVAIQAVARHDDRLQLDRPRIRDKCV